MQKYSMLVSWFLGCLGVALLIVAALATPERALANDCDHPCPECCNGDPMSDCDPCCATSCTAAPGCKDAATCDDGCSLRAAGSCATILQVCNETKKAADCSLCGCQLVLGACACKL